MVAFVWALSFCYERIIAVGRVLDSCNNCVIRRNTTEPRVVYFCNKMFVCWLSTALFVRCLRIVN
jgi:hypothetical protein